ncbi:aromatic amino acid hyroxylase biopterin-dependent [Chlamydia felis Fe/C-56]|uniref:Aromatic amino acid hyroxylase biopterin-dependent n=1 Tax=Chlamydia felis (strain Fe/C-56) TaxID=264202 RepID=Q255G4_CHLFF|nr:phenylalanine 4-monooxygenase [Chlamydia felis]BAE81074.1 aromatic amino acid hyroxylase biopterin-dependent [Chlamydia felis Fe/C-56]
MAHQIAATFSNSATQLQALLKPRFSLWEAHCPQVFCEYLDALHLEGSGAIDFDHINSVISSQSGFTLSPTQGYLSPHNYLFELSQKRFPIATNVRSLEEDGFSTLPDLIHDLFCHIPWLLHPEFVNFFSTMGELFVKSIKRAKEIYPIEDQPRILNSNALAISRCFWFTVESGLIEEQGKRKAYGAAVLSSTEQLSHTFNNNVFVSPFKTEHIIQRPCNPNAIQTTLFIIRDFSELNDISKKMHLFLEKGRLDFVVFGPHDVYYPDVIHFLREHEFSQK